MKQGELAEGNCDKAEVLNKHFSSVFTREGNDELPDFSQQPCQGELLDITFTASEIDKKLLNLKISKSPGPDQIHPRLLKEMHSVLNVPLEKLFTRLLKLGCPEAWKVWHITPICKKGNKSEVKLQTYQLNLRCVQSYGITRQEDPHATSRREPTNNTTPAWVFTR